MTVGQRLVAGSHVSKATTTANVKTKAGTQSTASAVSSKKGNDTAPIANKARGPVKGTDIDIFYTYLLVNIEKTYWLTLRTYFSSFTYTTHNLT